MVCRICLAEMVGTSETDKNLTCFATDMTKLKCNASVPNLS